MSKSIVVSVPHRLSAAEAKRRIAEKIEALRRDYVDKIAYSEVVWTGETANFRVVTFGQTTTGQLDVTADSVRIEVLLPWILTALSGTVQGALTSNAQDSLRIGHSPPKA